MVSQVVAELSCPGLTLDVIKCDPTTHSVDQLNAGKITL